MRHPLFHLLFTISLPPAIQTAKGDMRKRLGHAIRAPHRPRQLAQLGSQGIVDSPTSDDEVLDAAQSLSLHRHLQRVIDLHRNHCHEVEGADFRKHILNSIEILPYHLLHRLIG